MRIFKNKIKAIQKRRAQSLAREKKQRPKKIKIQPQPPTSFKSTQSAPRKQAITPVTPLTPAVSSSKKEYFHYKPKPSVDPSKSGQILRMEKVDSEDIEIDILSNSEDDDDQVPSYQMPIYPEEDEDEDDDESLDEQIDEVQQQYEVEYESNTSNSSIDEPDSNLNDDTVVVEDEHEDTIKKLTELGENDELTYKFVESTELPATEMILDPEEITQIEKFMLSEFFSGSPTKSPERYLKIRSHIISMWSQCKPLYLSKTASRQGLKKCGDVNSIGRVHLTLENLGVINFGCSEVKYILPLKFLYGIFQQSIRNKNQSHARTKHDSFSTDNVDTSPSGVSSNDTMVNRIKSRTQSRTQFELIKCQRYSKENVAPFEISITLSCLLCLYFHALSSKLEIMGFLGGHIDKSNGKSKISLKCYKPCRTSISTSISAEMCPVSQVEQSTDITESGFELLGWFHSHPTFPATPSRTDLKTQNEIQMQFAPNNPFIGFILSCLSMDFK
jgi:protein MYSM1